MQERNNASSLTERTLAIVDIGSNSGRVVVLQRTPSGHIETLEDVRAPLRLVRALDQNGSFPPEVILHTLNIMRDFSAVAAAAGASRTIAVATAAVREAPNGAELVRQIEAVTGFQVEIIDAVQEARYAFAGAIHGLAAEEGLLVDLGGGSMQIVQFKNRELIASWTVPLGCLRLSGRFLASDPPTAQEQQALVRYVRQTLTEAGIPRLDADLALVGTGGTIRNLAKVDRRAHHYPIRRLHGYRLTRARLRTVTDRLVASDATARAGISGLNSDRTDSITGGALAALTLMDYAGTGDMLVAGQGLRDGVAMGPLATGFPAASAVRAASVAALTARFSTWHGDAARRRAAAALDMLDVVAPEVSQEQRELLSFAATMLDVGRSVDYYKRYEHAAEIALSTDLVGFSHRAIALMAAVIQRADSPKASLKPLRPLVVPEDETFVAQAAAILRLADEIGRRAEPSTYPTVEARRAEQGVEVRAAVADTWRLNLLAAQMADYLGPLQIVSSFEE